MPSVSHRSRRSVYGAIPLGLACALALGACGSSARKPTADANGYSQSLKFAACMRSHGVSNYPDSSPSGRGTVLKITPGSGLNPQSPSFRSAQQACAKLMPGAFGAPPQMSASQYRSALKFAGCMRSHGLSSFPDPARSVSASAGPIFVVRGMEFELGSGLNPASPAFTRAAAACGVPHLGAA